jgi:hypothetical protein
VVVLKNKRTTTNFIVDKLYKLLFHAKAVTNAEETFEVGERFVWINFGHFSDELVVAPFGRGEQVCTK